MLTFLYKLYIKKSVNNSTRYKLFETFVGKYFVHKNVFPFPLNLSFNQTLVSLKNVFSIKNYFEFFFHSIFTLIHDFFGNVSIEWIFILLLNAFMNEIMFCLNQSLIEMLAEFWLNFTFYLKFPLIL